ncbi:Cof-type HAD-IIB family hydrolase [Sporolactobacillus shoreae]|nr:Cof-type HAD-IIB family hydrolase [Sporolactobacillus shoreae]
MPIKLIAVDMDGTFLDDQMSYNEQRFMRLYHEMKSRDIHFVVASGNQYFQLRSFFKGYEDIIYIAENGAYIADGAKEYFISSFEREALAVIFDYVARHPELKNAVCGKKNAYILRTADAAFISMMKKYYHKIQLVDCYDTIDDRILKFAISCPDEKTMKIIDELKNGLNGAAVPVSSGLGSIDLIKSGMHKANGLRKLGEVLGISSADMIAFGDGGNDVEMLKFVGCGVAMKNALGSIKAQADAVTDSNNDEGVLNYIEKCLNP